MSQYTIKDFLEVKASVPVMFNPDGSRIAYYNNDSGTFQLYVVSREGGAPIQLTQFEDVIINAAYSPVDELILFSKAEGGDENGQLYLLNVEKKQITPLSEKKDIKYNVGEFSRDGKYISYSSNERNGKDFDVYVMHLETRESRCAWSPGGSCHPGGFSPTGKYLALHKVHSNENSDTYLCDLGTNTIDHITPHEGDVYYGNPHWLPDESAFFMPSDRDVEFTSLMRCKMANKKCEYVMRPKWDISGVGISKNGKYLAIAINEDGYRKLSIYDPITLEKLPFEFPKGEVGNIRFTQDENFMAFSLADAQRTSDVWVANMTTGEISQITKSAQGVPPEALTVPELIRFKSFDGLEIPAFLYKPQDNDLRKTLPVIINIHGGPESQYTPSLALLTQYFIHAGYMVVAPNVRGSAGYGKTYMKLDNVEKRMDSVKDIVALRDYLKARPDVDVDKIILMGGSYGGFMVLACLAFYPGLWAAGIDTVGIANFITFLEKTAPYRRHLREAEYGSLEKDRQFLESISPINSVENIKTPLFIIHGANDPRVPLFEAEQMFDKLKKLGRSVELLVYPDEGHGLSKLKNRLDAYPRMVEFLKKILQ